MVVVNFYEKITSTFDINPVLSLIYNIVPGFKTATLKHDVENIGNDDTMKLFISIPGSFFNTWKTSVIGGGSKIINDTLFNNKTLNDDKK